MGGRVSHRVGNWLSQQEKRGEGTGWGFWPDRFSETLSELVSMDVSWVRLYGNVRILIISVKFESLVLFFWELLVLGFL